MPLKVAKSALKQQKGRLVLYGVVLSVGPGAIVMFIAQRIAVSRYAGI